MSTPTTDKRKSDTPAFTLKATPLHAPRVFRTVELLGSQDLQELAGVLDELLELPAAPAAFFLSDDPKDPGHGSREGQKSLRARLSTLGLKPQRRFTYAVDYIDDPLAAYRIQIEVLGVAPAQGDDDYPRVIDSAGAPPPPPGEEPPPELAADLRALAKEVAAAAADHEEASIEDEARPKKRVQADARLLLKLCQAVAERPDQLRAIEAEHDTVLFEWISDVPFELAEYGMADEAAALCQRLAGVCYPATLLGARAMILARAGQREAALAQVKDNLARARADAKEEGEDEDLEVLDQSAEVLLEVNELVQAEALTRRVLAVVGPRIAPTVAKLVEDKTGKPDKPGAKNDDDDDEAADLLDEDMNADLLVYGDALQRLAKILRRCGRVSEAKEVEAQLERHAALLEREEDFLASQIMQMVPAGLDFAGALGPDEDDEPPPPPKGRGRR